MINWKVRFKNKAFWFALIPAILILIQTCAEIFGVEVDTTKYSNWILKVIEEVFALLSIMGIVVDPTTSGLTDSSQAMTYDKPKEG